MAVFKLIGIEDGVKLVVENVSIKIYEFKEENIVDELIHKFTQLEPRKVLVEKPNLYTTGFGYALDLKGIKLDNEGNVLHN